MESCEFGMTKPLWNNTATRLGSYLMLVAAVLFWSATWPMPEQRDAYLEPLFDHSLGLPVASLPEAPDDDSALLVPAVALAPARPAYRERFAPTILVHSRLHVTRYPVLPQGPPALT